MILNLLDRMKLPFRKNKEFLTALYDILGFYPHNIELYRVAFAHKSLTYHHDSNKDRKKKPKKNFSENTSKPLNNERLEYLGDAVLETVVSDILFRHFEHKREGFLTSTRSKIVQRETLNKLAEKMGLERLIQAAQGTRVDHTNIGGNAFEALMGAIYLDRGFQVCHWFIANRVIGKYIDLENIAQKEVNFKSKLLEWSQKNRINLKFNDSLQDHKEKGFECAIVIEGVTLGRGIGRSKKEAQQAAAKEALTRMRSEAQTYDRIFRAKEKRTAMEAEESFALPKIDEIEESLKSNKRKGDKKPTADEAPAQDKNFSDEAYDMAYDENAQFEVIDQEETPQPLTQADYESKGLPLPPEENELKTPETRAEKRRNRNRTPKTVDEALNNGRKKKNEPKPEVAPQTKVQNQEEKNTEKADCKPQPKEKRNKKKQNQEVSAAGQPAQPEEPKDNSALEVKTAVVTFDEEPKADTPSFDVDDFEVISPEMLAALEAEEKELHEAAESFFERPSQQEAEQLCHDIDQTDWVSLAQTDQVSTQAEPDQPASSPEAVQPEQSEPHDFQSTDDFIDDTVSLALSHLVPPAPAQTETVPEVKTADETPALHEPDFIITKDIEIVAVTENEPAPTGTDETDTVSAEPESQPLQVDTAEESSEEPVPAVSAEPEQPAQISQPEAAETEVCVPTNAAPAESAIKEEQPAGQTPSQEKAEQPLPALHHLTLDEFLLGLTESSPNDAETLQENGAAPKKTKKSHHRNSQRPAEKPASTPTGHPTQKTDRTDAQATAPADQTPSAEVSGQPEAETENQIVTEKESKSDNNKRKRRYYRRRPTPKNNGQA